MNKVINNRELLRNYKEVKKLLKSGEVDKVLIEDNDGTTYTFAIEEKKSPIEELVEMVQKNPFTKLERPEEDLFDL